MLLNNHTANGETKSHPVRLRRKERSKYAVQFLGSNSRPRVFYCNHNCIATTKLRGHPQHPTLVSRGVHCFERVVNQIEDDLSQLTTIAVNKGQFG